MENCFCWQCGASSCHHHLACQHELRCGHAAAGLPADVHALPTAGRHAHRRQPTQQTVALHCRGEHRSLCRDHTHALAAGLTLVCTHAMHAAVFFIRERHARRPCEARRLGHRHPACLVAGAQPGRWPARPAGWQRMQAAAAAHSWQQHALPTYARHLTTC